MVSFYLLYSVSSFLFTEKKIAGIKKIKRATNLYEDVVNEIKKAILSGKYKTGEALPSETELARLLGVSRPVIREGIRVLQSRVFWR